MRRTTTPLTIAAIVALLACLASAVPAFAGPGEPNKPRVEDRRVVVLKGIQEEGGEGPQVWFSGLSSAYLGVELVGLTPELRIHFGVPDDRGVMVARVEEESPAAKAGLAVGDVITELEGESIETAWDLSLAVRQHEPGDEVGLEVWRDGRPLQFEATVGERERKRIEVGRLMREGGFEPPPTMHWTPKHMEGDGPSTVFIRPQVMEELGESLRAVDWEEIGEKMRSRNEVLEERIQVLEKRLQELEQRLDDANDR